MFSKTISILGCGWLGLALAEFLQAKGYSIKGSTTQSQKIPALKNEEITPYLLSFPLPTQTAHTKEFLDADILFLNIPFKRSLPDANIYRRQIESVVSCVESSRIKRVIFTSSTAVYPDTNGLVDEATPPDQNNPRAVVLSEIEQGLLTNKKFRACVIRFAGLFGPGRAIGSFFKKIPPKQLTNTPVNLIYLQDCLGIIDRILEKDVTGEILNACCDEHPLRKDLYTRHLPAELLKTVEFLEPKEACYKIVSNQKLKTRLSYSFVYSNPLDVPLIS